MEATKERAARCNRATPARTSGSSPAHGSRTKSIAHRRRRAKTRIRQAAVLLTAAAVAAGIVMVISSVATEKPAVSDAAAEQPTAIVTTPAESAQTPDQAEPTVRFYLSTSERDTVERVVMAEAGGESFEGQMLVAQCILNAAEKEGVQPSEAVVIYSYMPTKALVNIQGSFPAGSTLQVWICNNGNDAEPTWEDITQKALNSQKHFFTNDTKTAADWGVKIKVKLLRGSADGACYIQSVGGNFA